MQLMVVIGKYVRRENMRILTLAYELVIKSRLN